MKLLLALVALFVIAASIFADYKWRKWITGNKSQPPAVYDPPPAPPSGGAAVPSETPAPHRPNRP